MSSYKEEYLKNLKEHEKEELRKKSKEIQTFTEFANERGIHLNEYDFKYYQTIGIVAQSRDLVKNLLPDAISDKDGLYDFKLLQDEFEQKIFTFGYLYGPDFILMAHSYFRRGFGIWNGFAPRFIELFWKYQNPETEIFILLDPDNVRIDLNGHGYLEHDFWFGAKFKTEIGLISDGTIKLRPPLDIEQSYISTFFSDVYSLDIKWSTNSKEGIKTFQAEEFKTEEIKLEKNGTEYYPARYIHAEYDLKEKVFRHFDGAIHFYTEPDYWQRRDSDFNFNNKYYSQIKAPSQKLFKINGRLEQDSWIEFCSHFLTGNPLVFEYFEGKYPPHIQEVLEILRGSPES